MFGKERPQPHEVLGLTENEQLFDRISDVHFRTLLSDENTLVHMVELANNSFGEFQFITISRPTTSGRLYATFWGNGYHDYRERWIMSEWRWYESARHEDQILAKTDVEAMLRQRTEEIVKYATQPTQTERGRLFEILADLTDDDGALSDLEDMGDWFDE